MSQQEKADKLKTASIGVGLMGVCCLLFAVPIANALSFVLGNGAFAEMAVLGLGVVSVLVYFYLKTEAAKAAAATPPAAEENSPVQSE